MTLIEGWLNAVVPWSQETSPTDALTPHNASRRGLSGVRWDHVKEVWVELGFARIREAWQCLDDSAFTSWMKKLEVAAEIPGEWRARWWFEKCWYHLMRLETRQAWASVRSWPEDPALPYWEAKKAAVLATLGDHKDARPIARRALERVRMGRNRHELDVQSLSEEGWILHLLNRLELRAGASPFGREYEERGRRLDELRREHCDPEDDWTSRRWSLLTLEEEREAIHRSFDPGMATISLQSGAWRGEEWVVLFALHDGALPYVLPSELAVALRRTWPQSPHLSLSLAIQGGHVSKIKEGEALSDVMGRASVARLTNSQVTDLFEWLFPVLSDALDEEHAEESSRQRSRQGRIEGTAEVLSRLAFRLDHAAISSLLDLTCVTYSSPRHQAEFPLLGDLHCLFRRILQVSTQEQFWEWLPKLVRLPIVDEPSAKFTHGHLWDDPWAHLEPSILAPLTPAHGVGLSTEIERLAQLMCAQDVQSGEARWRASLRLAVLWGAGALTDAQLQRFSDAVWGFVDGHGYPSGVALQPWVLLKLPVPAPDTVRPIIFRFLCEYDPEDEHQEQIWIDGVMSTAAPLERPLEEDRRPSVAWTHEEARGLLLALRRVWGRRVESRRSTKLNPFVVARFRALLCRSIAPFLGADDLRGDVLDELLTSFAELAGCPAAVAPIQLLAGTTSGDLAAAGLHQGIVGTGAIAVREAADALLLWADLAALSRVPPVPEWLLDLVCSIVEVMRGPGLSDVLDTVCALLHRAPVVLSMRQLESISRGLLAIRSAMSLDKMGDDLRWRDEVGLDVAERVAVLAAASSLAERLYRLPSAGGADIPAINEWRTFAIGHPLPEVRAPWVRQA